MPTTPHGIIYPDSTGSTELWEHYESLATSTDTALDDVTTTAVDQATTNAVGQAKSYTDTQTTAAQDAAVSEANAYTDQALAGFTPGDTAQTAVTGGTGSYQTDANGQITITATPPADGTWTLVTITATPSTKFGKLYVPYFSARDTANNTSLYIVYIDGALAPTGTSVSVPWTAVFNRVNEEA